MLALLVGKKLVQQRETYFIKYKDVSVGGLEVGASVQYHGLDIGRVEDIIIHEEDINTIIVEISIKHDVPIREDVKAKLVTVGITGLKQIELTGGSSAKEEIQPGGYIPAGQSTIENITGKAEVIANKAEYLINNLTDLTRETNREKFSSILTKLDSLIVTFNKLITDNQQSLSNTINNLEIASAKMITVADTSIAAFSSIDRIASSKEMKAILQNTRSITDSLAQIEYSNIEEKSDSLYKTINQTVKDLNRTINNIDLTVLKSREDLVEAISSIEETSEILREFARKIKEDPSTLLRSRKR